MNIAPAVSVNIAPVTLDGRVYPATLVTTGANTTGSVYLHGARGSLWFLRPYLGDDTGHRQVINARTGRDMTDRHGKTIRVTHIGDTIERRP